ncbi:hypothetical protein [Dokdonia sinensis]|uniref:hypothetical protein n=1 Tax=Dokdonia sinensis TaxID=2479847 RepID=UPI001374E7B3|nr:hypothetical protein [Dokdonia sinensis]
MKNYYPLFLAVLFMSFCHAQTVNTTVKDETNERFELLEKNRIPNDILVEVLNYRVCDN